ncbi:retrovirus-related pol polyprotein from transposon TNT 1-94 [Tanacetum coccineum]
MASQDDRLSKFETDFKQQQSEMTNKIDMMLKAITDRIGGALPSDMVKNLKLSASLTSLPQTGTGIETQQPEEPEPTLENEFQDLHLNLPVLEVLAHAPIYNTILDKYVESLELGKNWSAFVQGEIPAKIEDPRLFTLPCRLGESEPFDALGDLGSLADGTKSYPVGIVKDVEVRIGKLKLLYDFYVIDMKKDLETPLLVERGFLATANAVIDCRMAKIAVGEGITRLVNARDAELNPIKDVLSKLEGWTNRLKTKMDMQRQERQINPMGEEFTKTLQSIPSTRKLSERESPREIIDLDHFYDT